MHETNMPQCIRKLNRSDDHKHPRINPIFLVKCHCVAPAECTQPQLSQLLISWALEKIKLIRHPVNFAFFFSPLLEKCFAQTPIMIQFYIVVFFPFLLLVTDQSSVGLLGPPQMVSVIGQYSHSSFYFPFCTLPFSSSLSTSFNFLSVSIACFMCKKA